MLKSYEKHVRHTYVGLEHEAWCGAQLSREFAFSDIDHLAYERRRGGSLLPCPKCFAAIVQTLGSKESIP